jgi:hypothetical protein
MEYFEAKMDKILKKELIHSKKERKRCKKMYPDWKDDEYNCGPLKFIWGIVSEDNLGAPNPSFYSLNDLDIYYNRDTRKFLLSIETIYRFDTAEEEIAYLEKLQAKFTEYIKGQKIVFRKANFSLLPYANGELFSADSIEQLYFNFKLFVHGYKDLKRSRK